MDFDPFVCFVFQGSLLCDRPVSGNNRLVKFASQIFLIFLILVTSKNKTTSASFLSKNVSLRVGYNPAKFHAFIIKVNNSGR